MRVLEYIISYFCCWLEEGSRKRLVSSEGVGWMNVNHTQYVVSLPP